MIDYQLQGKNALVLGNSKGIGKAITKSLQQQGVVVPDISRSTGYDLMTEEGIQLMFRDVLTTDILVCNLGGMGTALQFDYEVIMKKNFFVNFRVIHAYLSGMVYKKWGRVIFISSIYGKEKGTNPAFVAAKAAQIASIKSMAGKYEGVTFNAVCPGFIDVGKSFPDNPLIIGKPEDVAHLVTFLCSQQAKHINGAVITCDGGETHAF